MLVRYKTFPWAGEHFDDYETEEGETRYYLTPEGKLPSMTSMLSLLDDGGIDKWKKRVGEEEATRIVNEASKRGNSLHDLSEEYLNNRLQPQDLSGTGKVLFNRSTKYLDKIELVIGTEIALYNVDDGYAGRADGIVMINNRLTILDHKNTRNRMNLDLSYARKKLFKYQLQCCGYSRALEKMKGYKADQGCLIVGNHNQSNSERFLFDIEPLERELDIVIHAYWNGGEGLDKSLFFKL